MAEAQPEQSSPYVTAKDCLWMMTVGLPFIVGGFLGCVVLRKFDPFVLLMTVGYGIDMPLAWGWILIRVLRGEKLINPTTLPINNRLCDVELTVEKIRFGVSICWMLVLASLSLKAQDLKSSLPLALAGLGIIVTLTALRGISLQRSLRAWRAVGGKVGMPARQRQGYGTMEMEDGQ